MTNDGGDLLRLAPDSLVVLAGPSGAGKSTWASAWFRPSQIVSSDGLRGVVGEHRHDLRASAAAFDLLDSIVEHRLNRGLLTVVDSLGMDPTRNARWLEASARHGRPAVLVAFDDEDAQYRKRNRSRAAAVPSKVLSAQLKTWSEIRAELGRGFERTVAPGPVAVVAPGLVSPPGLSPSEAATPRLRFGLVVSAFDFDPESASGESAAGTPARRAGEPEGSDDTTAAGLARVAAEAERAGFDHLWLMDHYIQIPQVGREWDPMLEPYTALGYIAGLTERIELGTLVSCVGHRSIGHLAKSIATLDVLSGGRARCGLGIGWFEREHRAYGHRFAPTAERYEMLADALEALPLYWGPGSPPFEGVRYATPETLCYPRPLRHRVPILVGGSGPRRTLRLAAEFAQACNISGSPEQVARLVSALHSHCDDLGRDPAEVEVTHLSPLLAAPDAATLRTRLDRARPSAMSPEAYGARVNAAPFEVHADTFVNLAGAGVQTIMLSLADVGRPGAVAELGELIDQFRP